MLLNPIRVDVAQIVHVAETDAAAASWCAFYTGKALGGSGGYVCVPNG